MRLVLLLGVAMLAACSGGCGPKPLKQMSSSDCVTWRCSDKGECQCVGK